MFVPWESRHFNAFMLQAMTLAKEHCPWHDVSAFSAPRPVARLCTCFPPDVKLV